MCSPHHSCFFFNSYDSYDSTLFDVLYLYIKFPNKFKKNCLKQDHLTGITLESLYLFYCPSKVSVYFCPSGGPVFVTLPFCILLFYKPKKREEVGKV